MKKKGAKKGLRDTQPMPCRGRRRKEKKIEEDGKEEAAK